MFYSLCSTSLERAIAAFCQSGEDHRGRRRREELGSRFRDLGLREGQDEGPFHSLAMGTGSDARPPSLSEDGTKQGKALYIGDANLQAVGAWLIFCPAAVQPLLRRRGRLLAPPHRPAVRRRPCKRERRRAPHPHAASLPAQSVHVRVPRCLHAPCLFPGLERFVLFLFHPS
jgi:hypothetical protein